MNKIIVKTFSKIQFYYIFITDKFYYSIVRILINRFLRKYSLVDLGSAGELDNRLKVITSKALRIDGRSGTTKGGGIDEEHVDMFVGDGDKASFYITRKSTCSSLKMPDTEVINLYPEASRFDIKSIEEVQTTRLSDLLKLKNFSLDLLKIDVQGAEMEVLNGLGENDIKNIKVIEIECSVIKFYKGASSFSDVFTFLDNSGFDLYLLREQRWTALNQAHCKIAWFDAVFVNRVVSKADGFALSLAYKRFNLNTALKANYSTLLNGKSSAVKFTFVSMLVVARLILQMQSMVGKREISHRNIAAGSELW
jgi:FkbM family methyltransferase